MNLDQFSFMQSEEEPDHSDFIPVDARLMETLADWEIDLYVCRNGQTALYLSGDTSPSSREIEAIQNGMIRVLYITSADRDTYLDHLEQMVLATLNDTSLSLAGRAAALYRLSSSIMSDLFSNPDERFDLPRAKRVVDLVTNFIAADARAMLSLIAVSHTEPYMVRHAMNCCLFAVALSARLGIEDPLEIHALGMGCMLMDLGMSLVPRRIRQKSDPLTANDWKPIYLHPDHSIQLCRKRGEIPSLAQVAIAQHHERLDGTGYPRGLKGNEIHLFGRIASIVQQFDSLISDRPYRNRMSSFEALSNMKQEFTSKLDQELFREFVMLFKENSVNDLIENTVGRIQ